MKTKEEKYQDAVRRGIYAMTTHKRGKYMIMGYEQVCLSLGVRKSDKENRAIVAYELNNLKSKGDL